MVVDVPYDTGSITMTVSLSTGGAYLRGSNGSPANYANYICSGYYEIHGSIFDHTLFCPSENIFLLVYVIFQTQERVFSTFTWEQSLIQSLEVIPLL